VCGRGPLNQTSKSNIFIFYSPPLPSPLLPLPRRHPRTRRGQPALAESRQHSPDPAQADLLRPPRRRLAGRPPPPSRLGPPPSPLSPRLPPKSRSRHLPTSPATCLGLRPLHRLLRTPREPPRSDLGGLPRRRQRGGTATNVAAHGGGR